MQSSRCLPRTAPVLLYSLAHALHTLGLSIALWKINTEGTKVADVFYVNELGRQQSAPGPRFKEIREHSWVR